MTRVYTRVPPIDRFNTKWVRDEATGCHVWTASTNGEGRPLFYDGTRVVLAYRWIHELVAGKSDDPSKVFVCHAPILCHNELCVNPEHLRWATPSENAFDKNADGTMPSNRGMGKLSDDDVRAIRSSTGTTIEVGRQFGIHASQVSRIRNRRTWWHVLDE